MNDIKIQPSRRTNVKGINAMSAWEILDNRNKLVGVFDVKKDKAGKECGKLEDICKVRNIANLKGTTMKEEQKLLPSEYLGDGVYVKDEGHQLAISVNDHRNEPVVFLDPYALKALVRYAKRCDELRSQNLPTR